MGIFKAIRKLWLFARCDHRNLVRTIGFEDSTELAFCRGCGRLLWIMNDNDRTHNQHLKYPVLDFTKSERDYILFGPER